MNTANLQENGIECDTENKDTESSSLSTMFNEAASKEGSHSYSHDEAQDVTGRHVSNTVHKCIYVVIVPKGLKPYQSVVYMSVIRVNERSRI